MKLSDSGESRVRGYLYVFERSLRSFLSPQMAADAVREVESHIRESVAQAGDVTDERAALERILERLGSPMKVAQAYSLELVMDEAAVTGRFGAVARSLFHVAASGIGAFVGALGLCIGYTLGIGFVVLALMKPILPNNVGIWMRNAVPVSGGLEFPAPADLQFVTSYWIIPISLSIGLALLLVTHYLARRWIGWLRGRMHRRRQPAGL